MKPEMTLEISENYRYAAYADTDRFDYLHDWDWDNWGLYTLAIDRQYNDLALDTFGLNDKLEEIKTWLGHDWNNNQLEEAIAKSITRSGYSHIFLNLRGYSQGDWAYVVLYWNDEWLSDVSGLIDELEGWFRGDVYSVALERRETYTSPGGKEIHDWEILDQVCQVLIHDSNPWTIETCQNLVGLPEEVAA